MKWMIAFMALAGSRRFFISTWMIVFGLGMMVCSAASARSQQASWPGRHDGVPENVHLQETKAGSFVVTWRDRSGTLQQHEVDLTEVLDVIVEFTDVPLFIQQHQTPGAAPKAESFQARFAQFESDLAAIYRRHANKAAWPLPAPQIQREFYKVFAGVAVRVSRSALVPLQRLGYVKKIHLDQAVKALLDESVSLIRADSVWSRLGVLGDGVVVAILDSGIDYRHPALGGGFGEGFKVIGGYDVINDDSDPMDDHGHGTLVAGIVAADGDSVRGVAPHAQLLAVKVLDEHGNGQQSDIVAGIERALDPNDDDNLDDRVDVVNMSLGGSGHPDDPASTAVDNATLLGLTFAIAAGNEGFWGFNNISSPGTARAAITVGATDKQDGLDRFSSKGPNPSIYSIKPDVVAPGVDINTTGRSGGLTQHSGTSMAAPPVAGVAALLKALHPDWKPARIKAALVATAQDLGEEVMVQGGGRIDALQAAEATVLAVPPTLSFGLDDASQTQWTATQTIDIVNMSGAVEHVVPLIEGRQPGIRLTIKPPRFTLRPGTSQAVAVTLSVDNTVVPAPQEGSLAFDGAVVFTSERHTLRVPWAFVNAAKVRLVFDEPGAFFYLFNENDLFTFFDALIIDPQTFELTVPRGTYDLVTVFRGDFRSNEPTRVVIQENVAFESSGEHQVLTSEAVHAVHLAGVDDAGRALSAQGEDAEYRVSACLGWPGPPQVVINRSMCLPRLRSDTLLVSNMSERFTMVIGEFYRDAVGSEDRLFVVQHTPLRGLQDDVTLANAPTDFIEQHIDIKLPRAAPAPSVTVWSAFLERWPTGIVTGSYSNFEPRDVTPGTWNSTLYITPDVHENYGFSAVYRASAQHAGIRRRAPWIQTEPFRVIDDSVSSFFWFAPSPDLYRSPDGGTMRFGYGPIYPSLLNITTPELIRIAANFNGPLNERRETDHGATSYTLYDAQDRVLASEDKHYTDQPVAPGLYRVVFANTNYDVAGIPGQGRLTTRFDTRRDDLRPPALTSMKLLDADGVPTDHLANGEAATLLFSAIDTRSRNDSLVYVPLASAETRLRYRVHGGDVWQDLDFVEVLEDVVLDHPDERPPIGHLYRADLSALAQIEDAALDLQIDVQDQSGNTTTWVLEPAWAIGEVAIPVNVEVEPEASIPLRFQIYPNYPNPFNTSTTIRFEMPRQETVRLTVYDLLGREVRRLHDGPLEAGRHRVVWNGQSTAGQPVATGVYFYRIEAGSFSASKTMMVVR